MQTATFKVKQAEGSSLPLRRDVDAVLKQGFSKGLPSVRFSVKGQPYKFDFARMQQKNLLTGEVCPLIKPLGLVGPPAPAVKQLGPRPAFVVRVPAGGPGKQIKVPHPKILGKALRISVPASAKAGQYIFVPIPSRWGPAAAYGGAGFAGGAVVTAGVLSHEAIGGAAAAVAATAGSAAPFILGGLAVAGLAVGAVAAADVARRHPGKVAAGLGAVFVGCAAADYVAEHGVAEAAGDAAEAAGDAAEAAGGAASGLLDAASELGGAASDVGDFVLDDVLAFVDDLEGDFAADAVLDFFEGLF